MCARRLRIWLANATHTKAVGGGVTPLYIKGVNRINTDEDTIPIPIFFTEDFVNQAITLNGSVHLVTLSLAPSDSDFFDCMDSLVFLPSKIQSSLELLDNVSENGTIINKTEESLEQIEDVLTNGSGHGGYLCLIKLSADVQAPMILTILTYVAP